MKITASNIPEYFPDGYNEQYYLVSTRSVNQLKDISTIETSEKYKILNDETWENRKVQAVSYDKYTIEFITTENIDIGIFDLAEDITITLDDGDIHQAKFLELSEPQKLKESEFRLYNLTYIDLNSKATINYLSTFSSETSIAKFKSGITSTYTKIYPIFGVTEYDKTENEDNYIKLVSSDSAFKTISFVAYVRTGDLNNIKEGLSANYLSDMYIEYDNNQYVPLEVPEIIEETDESLEDLTKITVILKYNQILNYPFTSATEQITWAASFYVSFEENPVSNAKITVDGYDPIYTDSLGTASILLPNGTYNYEIYFSDSYELITGSFVINNTGAQINEVLELVGSYNCTFTVTDSLSNPLYNAEITVGIGTYYTNTEGVAVATNLEPNNYIYNVVKSGYNNASGGITIVNANITESVIMTT